MSLHFERNLITRQRNNLIQFSFEGKSIEQEIKLRILRDLWNLNWDISIGRRRIEVRPPDSYDKATIQQMMSLKRDVIINENREWINKRLDLVRANLAEGIQVLTSKVKPIIEVCETKAQHELFRMLRYYWSSPYSDYVGRRIKIIVRDAGLKSKPIIGIAALGSPIIHIPERDDFIGWDKDVRTRNLIYTMDAYTIGAVPPYNLLLGGKLISMVLASNEIRKIYKQKYKNSVTLLEKRKASHLVGIFTTSLYGRSSQYNRLSFHGSKLFHQIGFTKGYGSFHLSEDTIYAMIEFLKQRGMDISHRFGDGPSWVMRIIRAAGDALGFDSNFLLKHSFRRGIYFVPLASNYREFLLGETKKPDYHNYPLRELTDFWRTRWLNQRLNNPAIVEEILRFSPSEFQI